MSGDSSGSGESYGKKAVTPKVNDEAEKSQNHSKNKMLHRKSTDAPKAKSHPPANKSKSSGNQGSQQQTGTSTDEDGFRKTTEKTPTRRNVMSSANTPKKNKQQS